MIYLLKWWFSIVMLVYQRVYHYIPHYITVLTVFYPRKSHAKSHGKKSSWNHHLIHAKAALNTSKFERSSGGAEATNGKNMKKKKLIKTISHFLMPLKAFPLFFSFSKVFNWNVTATPKTQAPIALSRVPALAAILGGDLVISSPRESMALRSRSTQWLASLPTGKHTKNYWKWPKKLLTCLTSEFTLPLVLNVIMTHICFILCMAQSFSSKLHDPIWSIWNWPSLKVKWRSHSEF